MKQIVPSDITIRPVRDPDSAALFALLTAVFAEYPGCLMETSEYPELLQPASSFAKMSGQFWVAEFQEEVVGSIAIIPNSEPHRWEIKKLYTYAQVRGIGLGKTLLDSAETYARHAQAKSIHLWTDTRFRAAHRFYERQGYQRLADTRHLNDVSQSVEYHYQKLLNT
ncbi:MAG: GNAT family N-acetyltransferase [Cyanobacteriota bacterium]|nr:GNAT family N-acetyltransferase [Cyanobacteriota bacterium]